MADASQDFTQLSDQFAALESAAQEARARGDYKEAHRQWRAARRIDDPSGYFPALAAYFRGRFLEEWSSLVQRTAPPEFAASLRRHAIRSYREALSGADLQPGVAAQAALELGRIEASAGQLGWATRYLQQARFLAGEAGPFSGPDAAVVERQIAGVADQIKQRRAATTIQLGS